MIQTESDLYKRIINQYPEVLSKKIVLTLQPTSRDEIWTVHLKSKKCEVITKVLRTNLAIFKDGSGKEEHNSSLGQIISWMD